LWRSQAKAKATRTSTSDAFTEAVAWLAALLGCSADELATMRDWELGGKLGEGDRSSGQVKRRPWGRGLACVAAI